MHFIKGAMMFDVTGDQLKGISNICCKKSEDRWTILLKAKSSDDIKGKRQRENTKVRKISKNPHSKRGFFISCLAEKLYLLNIKARLQVVHNKLNILCNFCNCTQVSITVNLHNTQFMMHFFNGFFTVNSWI